MEPVFFHALPESCWSEILHAFRPVSVIDLTASDEALPLACVKACVPYVGFCMTEFHQEALWQRLARSALRDAADETDNLYDRRLANAIKYHRDRDPAGDTDEKGTLKQKRNPKANSHTTAKEEGSEYDKGKPVAKHGNGGDSGVEDDDADLGDGPEAEDRWEALARLVKGDAAGGH